MNHSWPARVLGGGLIAVMAICLFEACNRVSDVCPLSPSYSIFDLTKVPLITVGEALEKCHPIGGLQVSRWNNRPVQLWEVRIKIEHIVQGNAADKIVDVSYFVDQGGSTGGWSHLTDIQPGHTEIFFLQKDGDKWRTICEGWRSCVLWVRTGSHYKYKIDRTLPVADILVNLLLSRGDQTSDQQMIDAIYHPEGRWGWELVFTRLKQLEREEHSPPVRAAILDNIRNFKKYYGVRGADYVK